MLFRKRWVLVCPNQISFNVAQALLQSRKSRSWVLLIYNKQRSQQYPWFRDGVFYCSQEQRKWMRIVVMGFRLFGGFELFAPHRKFYSFLVRLFAQASKVSLLDDGLDTLRDVSQNIEPDEFAEGTAFYAFSYPMVQLGQWLDSYRVYPFIEPSSLANSALPMMDWSSYETIVVESPPLSKVHDDLRLRESSTLLIQHSNVNKRAISEFSCPVVSGIDVPLEKSLSTFSGHLIVGESMVAVFAAQSPQPLYQVTVYLDRTRVVLLRPLLELLKSASWVEVRFC